MLFCNFYLHHGVLNAHFLWFCKLSSLKLGIFFLIQNMCRFPSAWPPSLSSMIKLIKCGWFFSYLGSEQTNFRAGDRGWAITDDWHDQRFSLEAFCWVKKRKTCLGVPAFSDMYDDLLHFLSNLVFGLKAHKIWVFCVLF